MNVSFFTGLCVIDAVLMRFADKQGMGIQNKSNGSRTTQSFSALLLFFYSNSKPTISSIFSNRIGYCVSVKQERFLDFGDGWNERRIWGNAASWSLLDGHP